MIRISKYVSSDIAIDLFQSREGESWCIYGSNRSGISGFLQLFSENSALPEGTSIPEKTAVISFARQQEIFEEELKKDNSDFLDKIDPGTLAQEFIANPELHGELISAFNLQHCLHKGYRQLSSGESRKLILLSALSTKPDLLIFENPYDGVDIDGCDELDKTFAALAERGQQIVITVNNPQDIPPWCSHLALIHDGAMLHQGRRSAILPLAEQYSHAGSAASYRIVSGEDGGHTERELLVSLTDGFARYGEEEIFTDLNLDVHTGEHTLLTGPNGSGKSTLLQIITGDNQNCYGNDLHIFGIKRGSGESIWQLKQHMGIVSPDLHRNYYIPGSAMQAVLSGLFDSIGVYTECSKQQKQEALSWLEMIGLQHHARTAFRQLSYAEQRLCLIARALIKMPRLLILDEPTQSLDQQNRENLLDFLEKIAERKLSTIIYASHRRDEFRSFFHQHIDLS